MNEKKFFLYMDHGVTNRFQNIDHNNATTEYQQWLRNFLYKILRCRVRCCKSFSFFSFLRKSIPRLPVTNQRLLDRKNVISILLKMGSCQLQQQQQQIPIQSA